MRKVLNTQRLLIAGLVLAGLALITTNDNAQARPQYNKAFPKKYEGLASQAKKVKCGVCHAGKKNAKDKKPRNDYGMAVQKALGKKNVKGADAIDAGLTKAEKAKNKKGVTFGSLIKAGEAARHRQVTQLEFTISRRSRPAGWLRFLLTVRRFLVQQFHCETRMLMVRHIRQIAVVGLFVAGLVLGTANDDAKARPKYIKAFTTKYPALTPQVKRAKCNVCHAGKKKKNRNDYGKALKRNRGGLPIDPAVINRMLTKTEGAKNKKGQTFGSLIKAGKLPGTAPKPK